MAKTIDHMKRMEEMKNWAKQDGLNKCFIYVASETDQSGKGQIWYDGKCSEGECASMLAEMMRGQPLFRRAATAALECVHQEELEDKIEQADKNLLKI